jgi:AraC family transcriptional regulator
LDVSKVKPLHSFHGLEMEVRSFDGARAVRVVHPAGQRIPAHRHDWPLLTLPALGGYLEECEEGSVAVAGPAVILHPPGRCHANCIHASGMETFSIEFDPAWLGPGALPRLFDRSFYWIGGEIPLASRALARLWTDPAAGEDAVRSATANFLFGAMHSAERPAPEWLPRARAQLAAGHGVTALDLARALDLHPRWLAQAYRSAIGEGLHETVLRGRVEQAVRMLRSTDQPIAEIAVAAGFCDQSHLNRAMRRFTGRTPLQVRGEREALAALLS